MKYIVTFLLLIPNIVLANCYVVGDLVGYSSRAAENFAISEDALSDQLILVELKGNNSSVSAWDVPCSQLGENTVVCSKEDASYGTLTIETWSIYPEIGKAAFTKIINGYGAFDGATIFSGEITGKCN